MANATCAMSHRPALVLAVLVVLAGGALYAEAPSGEAEKPILPLDRTFVFAYGSWEKKARIEGGVALLDAEGMTPKGGAGVAGTTTDLAAHADDCPALRVKVGPRNTLKTLRLLLGDGAEHTGAWHFALPKPSDKAAVLTPVDGAPLSQPNEPGKTGLPALGRITQWQLIGDYGGDGAVDVRVEAILAVKPTDEIRAARKALGEKAEAARVQAEKDRQAARAQYAKRTEQSPEIQAVYAAAPDVLAIQIHTGKLTPCRLTEYKPQPGDVRDDKGGKEMPHLMRNGKNEGLLIGPVGKETGLVASEGFSGDPLLLAEADDAANYKVRSADDPAFAEETAPLKVMRKSKPDDWQQPIQPGVAIRHNLYLKLPHALTPGKTYTVSLGFVNTQKAEATLVFDTSKAWSESIHVNQVGFRPDDPLKRAYLSVWMGPGGGATFPAVLAFHLVDAGTGRRVYTGKVGEAWPADKPEKMQVTRNFNGTAVSPMDFSDFQAPGRYRVEVEGVGASYPFPVGPKVWQEAFWVQMKGFYNQRSGIDLGPPYTDFVRPACFKLGVNDCLPITQSTYSNMDGGKNPQADLAKGDTGKPVPEAWGGYHDAGDWNPRRITHMGTTTFWQLELLEMFPEYFKSLKLNLPNDVPGPDLLKECLFELGLFHRLQTPEGGVSYGIETNGDPAGGEVSWKQRMPAYVFAADPQSSYFYAAVASRASAVLEAYDKALAQTYRESALKAMQWAEAERTKRKAAGKWDETPQWWGGLVADRTRAAVCLFALTRDPAWHQIFLEGTTLKTDAGPMFRGNQPGRDVAFTYARLPEGVGDPQIKKNARQAMVADADGSLAYQRNNAFGIASDDPGRPHILGFYSMPHGAVSLVRAYHLTHDAKYLAGAVGACLFPAGANPGNLVFTSGVGANPVKGVLNLDALATGQKLPIGLVPYGPIDLVQWHDGGTTWPFTWFLGKGCQPGPTDWPTTESYFDVRFLISLDEFCTDQTMGPNAYVWGYLAARI